MEILNKKAKHDYELLETITAGIVLNGNEVKSIKNSNVSIKESFISIKNNEVFIQNMYIKKYEQANTFKEVNEKRERKLLLNKKEIKKLKKEMEIKGYTIVPLKLYLIKGLIKLDISLAKGKKKYDKRNDLKLKSQKRDIEQNLKNKGG